MYGTQTSRQPFVREEPVRAKYRQAPTPLSIPANGEDKHSLSKSRIRSPERSSQSSSPSDPISPGRRSPRSHRGMSPPEMASIPVLPTSLPPTQGVATPVSSIHPDTLGYTTVPVSTFSTPLMMPPTSQASYPGSGLALTTPQPAYVPSEQPASSAGIPAWNATPKYRDAGDAPFIFSPELEAATAAKLQAALQISSFTQPPASTTVGYNYMPDGSACTSSNLFFLVARLADARPFYFYRHRLVQPTCCVFKLIASMSLQHTHTGLFRSHNHNRWQPRRKVITPALSSQSLAGATGTRFPSSVPVQRRARCKVGPVNVAKTLSPRTWLPELMAR